MKINSLGIHHVCIKVPDLKESVDFYTKTMNYEVRLEWDGGAMLKAPDGTHLELFPVDGEEGYAHVAYRCDDVDEAYRLAVAAGCASVKEPCSLTIASKPPLDVRMAFVADPSGNTIELFHEV